MSDVREQLHQLLTDGWYFPVRPEQVDAMTDAILERFDVMPKPVVTAARLGFLAADAVEITGGVICERAGKRLMESLASDGLMIVKVPDAS